MALTQIKSSNITDGTIVNADVNASAAIASTKLSGVESGLTSVQTITASGTWTKPTGVTKVIVEVTGGGGGGSSGDGSNWGGCGGAAAYVKQYIDVSSISTSSVVVGIAGTAGATGAGGAGGTSSWIDGTNTISCTGGAAGEYGAGHGNGGLGGTATATGATLLVNGQNGGQTYSYAGTGGSGPLGQGGLQYEYEENNGPAATGYGAGGCGGKGAGTARHGGAGTVGLIIVWEYK